MSTSERYEQNILAVFGRLKKADSEADRIFMLLCLAVAIVYEVEINLFLEGKQHEYCEARMLCFHILRRTENFRIARIVELVPQSISQVRRMVTEMDIMLERPEANKAQLDKYQKILTKFTKFKNSYGNDQA